MGLWTKHISSGQIKKIEQPAEREREAAALAVGVAGSDYVLSIFARFFFQLSVIGHAWHKHSPVCLALCMRHRRPHSFRTQSRDSREGGGEGGVQEQQKTRQLLERTKKISTRTGGEKKKAYKYLYIMAMLYLAAASATTAAPLPLLLLPSPSQPLPALLHHMSATISILMRH